MQYNQFPVANRFSQNAFVGFCQTLMIDKQVQIHHEFWLIPSFMLTPTMKVKLKKQIWEFVNDVNDFLTKSDNSF